MYKNKLKQRKYNSIRSNNKKNLTEEFEKIGKKEEKQTNKNLYTVTLGIIQYFPNVSSIT